MRFGKNDLEIEVVSTLYNKCLQPGGPIPIPIEKKDYGIWDSDGYSAYVYTI
ncbi:hypothetical protein GI584_02250 [Gracilibacillus salitolerans]|uniref:Uncharacterized protein n=2 Tax=Gracilibacillus TaxID=74385 RepID=W4VQW0_9BACI|nr:hypothetical protein GI584_02250 [Gracilibacillus salitolerans]GAE95319.1 hypothetical protein JCM21714_4543 [Gracilibacillus boraciitolerans JCM 21714]